MLETYEADSTKQFTFQSSIAPDSAPRFCVYNGSGTLIGSLTSASSDSTHYYAMMTVSSTEGIYVGEWYAVSTVNGDVYPFYKRELFNVVRTRSYT